MIKRFRKSTSYLLVAASVLFALFQSAPPVQAVTGLNASISASNTSIQNGWSTTISWSSSGPIDACQDPFGGSDPNGSQSVTPSSTTTYTIYCYGDAGEVSKSVTVTVASPTPTPTPTPQQSNTPTPTPTPTQAPVDCANNWNISSCQPTIGLSASPNPVGPGSTLTLTGTFGYYPYPNNSNDYTATCYFSGGSIGNNSYSSSGTTGQFGYYESVYATITTTISSQTVFNWSCSSSETGTKFASQTVSLSQNSLAPEAQVSQQSATPSSGAHIGDPISLSATFSYATTYSWAEDIVVTGPGGYSASAFHAGQGGVNVPDQIDNVTVSFPTTGLTAGTYTATFTAQAKSANPGSTSVSDSKTASFTLLTPPRGQGKVQILKSGTGTGTVVSGDNLVNCGTDCLVGYPANTSVSLSATADNGSTFAGWSGGGCSGTGGCSVVIPDASTITVTATFNSTPQGAKNLTVTKQGTGTGTVTANDGTINCGSTCVASYNDGRDVILSATAGSNSTFSGWGGDCSGTGSCSVRMNTNHNVTATFTSTESPPVTPTNVVASLWCSGVPSSLETRVSWSASAGATSYTISRSDNGGPWTFRGISATNSYTDTSSVTGHTYTYAVVASNNAGDSAQSAPSNPVTPQSGTCWASALVQESVATGGDWSITPDSIPTGRASSYVLRPESTGTLYTISATPPSGYYISEILMSSGSATVVAGGGGQQHSSLSDSITVYPGETVRITVTYTNGNLNSCQINVGSTYNGAPGNPPGGFNYTLTNGGTTLNGSGSDTFSVPKDTTWTITYTGGSTSTFAGYTPAQSQSCTGGGVTFTLNFSDGPPGGPKGPGGVGSPLDENTASNGAVPCGQVSMTWGAGTRADSYNLYKSTDPANKGAVWVNTTALTYSDTPSVGVTTYYWVQSKNAYGVSDPATPFSPFGIQGTPCSADFSTSNQVVTNVNGQTYTYTSSCAISSQSGVVKTIKQGDRVTLSVDICNSGNLNANNVTVSIDLSNTNLNWNNPPNVTMTGGSARNYSINGNVGTFTFGTINSGFNARIVYDAVVAGSSPQQKLLRFFSNANMSFTTSSPSNNLGCRSSGTDASHPCVLGTGYVVYYTGNRTPSQEEVNP